MRSALAAAALSLCGGEGAAGSGVRADCLSECAAVGAAGCCLATSTGCEWYPGGHVNGGSHQSGAQSANCYADRHCDGWNSEETCSGSGEPVPSPGPTPPTPPPPPPPSGDWKLVWSDEFDSCPGGRPDTASWGYEHGFVRNHEQQWYQEDNAACVNGSLVIAARREHPAEQPSAEYTSSSLRTMNKKTWTYGRFELRAKIPIDTGSWPAWWTLGTSGGWPNGGEIDIMEYYRGKVLANFDYGNSQGNSVWNSKTMPVDAAWASQFHTWGMEWNSELITLTLDGTVMNTEKVSAADGTGHDNPWRNKSQYMIINLAIGGQNGGDPSGTKFPLEYIVDYVRVYQQKDAPVQ